MLIITTNSGGHLSHGLSLIRHDRKEMGPPLSGPFYFPVSGGKSPSRLSSTAKSSTESCASRICLLTAHARIMSFICISVNIPHPPAVGRFSHLHILDVPVGPSIPLLHKIIMLTKIIPASGQPDTKVRQVITPLFKRFRFLDKPVHSPFKWTLGSPFFQVF